METDRGTTESVDLDDSAVGLSVVNDSMTVAVSDDTDYPANVVASTELTDSSKSKDSGFESKSSPDQESAEPYTVTVHWNCLYEMVLMDGHTKGFDAENLYSKVRKGSEEPESVQAAKTETITKKPETKASKEDEFDSDVELSLDPGYAECADAIKDNVENFYTKMPITRCTPNIKMKNWVDVPRNAHLEKETRLMQHAIQRYKVELSVMETMLTTMYTQAQSDMGHEERAEVEELQQLWSGVRKEVDKMELLLTDRLKALGAGNDSYSPLDALQIIQAMIDLLREQLYHQQMCITKDYRLHSDDPEDLISSMSTNGTSPRSMSTNSALLSDLSQQVSEVKEEVSRSQEMQKQALQETSELKSSLLVEVKGEMSATTNAKMLQLQLQARDNEIQQLRMELLLQSVESSKTRKRMTLESDM